MNGSRSVVDNERGYYWGAHVEQEVAGQQTLRRASRVLLVVLLLSSHAMPLRAGVTMSDFGGTSLMSSMMDTMWDMMEWFFLSRPSRYNDGKPGYRMPGPYPRASYPPSNHQSGPLWGRLDGVWRASSGEYWIVQGSQFILALSPNDAIRGQISVQQDKIIAYLPDSQITTVYRYWVVDGMLIVRDRNGHAMVLDLIQPAAQHWRW